MLHNGKITVFIMQLAIFHRRFANLRIILIKTIKK